MKIIVKLLRHLIFLILILFSAVCLYQITACAVFGQKLPSVLGYSSVTVLSGSMEPAFSAGDQLIIRREAQYDPGDIISFWNDGILITHRIVKQTNEGSITKGDNNNTQDEDPVRPEQIAGRVVLILPGVGNTLLFLRKPKGILTILFLGLLIWILPGFIKRINDHGKGDRI